MTSLDQDRVTKRITLALTVLKQTAMPQTTTASSLSAIGDPAPDADPWQTARDWWGALRRRRKAGFCAGLLMYFGSYEYIHDFGVKHPYPAFVGVLLMIVSGGIGID